MKIYHQFRYIDDIIKFQLKNFAYYKSTSLAVQYRIPHNVLQFFIIAELLFINRVFLQSIRHCNIVTKNLKVSVFEDLDLHN